MSLGREIQREAWRRITRERYITGVNRTTPVTKNMANIRASKSEQIW
jgi:hypothetical protein